MSFDSTIRLMLGQRLLVFSPLIDRAATSARNDGNPAQGTHNFFSKASAAQPPDSRQKADPGEEDHCSTWLRHGADDDIIARSTFVADLEGEVWPPEPQRQGEDRALGQRSVRLVQI